VPLDEIRRYVGVYNAVREAYVDPVDDKKLMHSAIKGLLLDLDPHSAYLDKSDAQAFDEETNGAYAGIGVEVQLQPDGKIKIIAPIDDTPAARAGIKSGDIITAVNGKPVSGNDDDSQGPLRGVPGSKVTLTLVRASVAKPFDVTLQRETIRIASVRGRMLEPGYAYVRVAAFQADTAADFERSLEQLQAQAGGDKSGKGLRGLVLDLRSNPGGLLTSAVQIADDLLDKGTIVSTRGRIAISDSEFSATPGDRMHGAPVVALVDAGSARGAHRQPSRPHRRQPHLRQGLGANTAAAGQRRLGQAHHRALLHTQRQIDPGARDRTRRGAASGQGRRQRRSCRLRRSAAARAPARRRRGSR